MKNKLEKVRRLLSSYELLVSRYPKSKIYAARLHQLKQEEAEKLCASILNNLN